MGSSWSKPPPTEFAAAWDRYCARQKQRSAIPQPPGILLGQLKTLLDGCSDADAQSLQKVLEDAQRAAGEVQEYLSREKCGSYPTSGSHDRRGLIPVYVVWDKKTKRGAYHAVLQDLLKEIFCEEVKQKYEGKNGIHPTLFICRTPTGRLLDVDLDYFYTVEDPKALIVLRSGNNELAFPCNYSSEDVVDEGTLVVQLLHYEGHLTAGNVNTSGIEKLRRFARATSR